MGRVYAENRSKMQKLLGVKGLKESYSSCREVKFVLVKGRRLL